MNYFEKKSKYYNLLKNASLKYNKAKQVTWRSSLDDTKEDFIRGLDFVRDDEAITYLFHVRFSLLFVYLIFTYYFVQFVILVFIYI